jgi:hypothetical protein
MAEVALPGGKVRHYRSFAAKFAHFFISHDRFPVRDRYAEVMLRAHLGHSLAPTPDSGAPYTEFETAFRMLAQQVGLGSDTRRLDRYLWIVGGYRAWRKTPDLVNSELREIFEADPPELAVAAGLGPQPAGF